MSKHVVVIEGETPAVDEALEALNKHPELRAYRIPAPGQGSVALYWAETYWSETLGRWVSIPPSDRS
jgi:hypothetical protein